MLTVGRAAHEPYVHKATACDYGRGKPISASALGRALGILKRKAGQLSRWTRYKRCAAHSEQLPAKQLFFLHPAVTCTTRSSMHG